MSLNNQELCQNMYISVYLYLIVIFGHFKYLLNSYENGHSCPNTDDNKLMLRD